MDFCNSIIKSDTAKYSVFGWIVLIKLRKDKTNFTIYFFERLANLIIQLFVRQYLIWS